MLRLVDWPSIGKQEEGEDVLPHERKLLTDQQLRDASVDQIENLVQRLNLLMRERGLPGLVWSTTPEDRPQQSDPLDPNTFGSV